VSTYLDAFEAPLGWYGGTRNTQAWNLDDSELEMKAYLGKRTRREKVEEEGWEDRGLSKNGAMK